MIKASPTLTLAIPSVEPTAQRTVDHQQWSFARFAARCVRIIVMTEAMSATIGANDQTTPPSPAMASVAVELRDGRQFIARVDHRTNEEVLWLRRTRGNTTLSTGFTWDLVRSVVVGTDRYEAAEFRDRASYFASRENRSLSQQSSTDPILNEERPASIPDKVHSLSVTANVANWDRDAEVDGIELRLIPRAANGRSIPVKGAVKAELFGRNLAPVSAEPPLVQIERWSQVLNENVSDPSGTICRLTFRSVNPEQDLNLQSFGLLRVQLNVSGQGDFFAESAVRIRTYNPIRDQLLEHQLHHDSFGRYRGRHW